MFSNFAVDNDKTLTSFKDIRARLEGTTCNNLTVSNCDLRSLEGSPKVVQHNFNIKHNTNLKSLKGGPRIVGDNYIAYDCDLRSLEGAPEEVGKMFDISDNPNLTIDNILKQRDFQELLKNIKNYTKIKVDKEIKPFLMFLTKLSKGNNISLSAEKVKLLWKASNSLK